MPSASTVALATTSEPGSKLASSSPSLPRPRSPERTPAHDPVLDQQLRRGGLGEDVDARLLGLLGEEAAQLRDRGDVVAVVAEVGRHRLQRERRLRGEEVDARPWSPPGRPANRTGRGRGTAPASPRGACWRRRAGARPATLPFSITATGTSPSFSVSSGSSSSSCISLFAQARPAGPPPTIATPTSIRSSSGVGRRADHLGRSRTAAGTRLRACVTARHWLSRPSSP